MDFLIVLSPWQLYWTWFKTQAERLCHRFRCVGFATKARYAVKPCVSLCGVQTMGHLHYICTSTCKAWRKAWPLTFVHVRVWQKQNMFMKKKIHLALINTLIELRQIIRRGKWASTIHHCTAQRWLYLTMACTGSQRCSRKSSGKRFGLYL